MRIIVCGGRDYDNSIVVNYSLDTLNVSKGISHIIQGGADGADAIALKWAIDNKIDHTTVKADWGKHGKAAGPIRNGEMLKLYPDVVVAFPGGSGTADMVSQAKRKKIEVIEVED